MFKNFQIVFFVKIIPFTINKWIVSLNIYFNVVIRKQEIANIVVTIKTTNLETPRLWLQTNLTIELIQSGKT